jgi:hypothetical protein
MALRVQEEDVGCIGIYLLVGTAEFRIIGTGHSCFNYQSCFMLGEAVVSIFGQEICCTELLGFVSFSTKKQKPCLEITHINLHPHLPV